jgi:3-hydroxyisobutyrate dehydrogenase-like beta-hydroxyacid dehydrogenase
MTAGPVAVIGTGAMGGGVVQSLARAGIPVIARDIRADAQARAVAHGARAAGSAREAGAGAAVAIILVVDAGQVDTVLFGADGLVEGMAQGGIVLLSSTVDPAYARALGPRLDPHGLVLLDAPVSGGPAKAAAGTMTMMVAGAAAARARVGPVLAAISGRVFVIGDRPGDAATMKIVNNLLAAANLAAGAEALALGMRAGLDAQLMADVIGASSGASWIVADRLPRALARDYAPRAATRVLAKDAAIAAALAERLGVAAPFASLARAAFAEAVTVGHGEEDDAAMFLFAKERTGRSGA